MIYINMQFRATLLILLVMLIRHFLLYKVSKKVFLCLWVVVLARLLIPYSMNVYFGFSVPNIESLWISLMSSIFGVASTSFPGTQVATMTTYTIPLFIWIIWATGFFLLMSYFIIIHIKARRIYRFAYPLKSKHIQQWVQENEILRNVVILQCSNISSPLTYGVFRPVILLPVSINLDDYDSLSYVLSHELIHIKHYDILWKWILTLVLCLNWYNPLIWKMYFLIERDIELYCDECVLKRLGSNHQQKSGFAMTLLMLAEKKSQNHSVSMVSHFSQNQLEERLLSIMNYHVTSYLIMVILILGIIFLTWLSFVTFMMESGIAMTLPL